MKRLKLFVENFLVYGLGGVLSKIIPLIMLPIITRLMPDTTYFGLNDIFTVVVNFGQSIAIMGMYDAMFRLFFEKEDTQYKKEICSSALVFTCFTSIVLFMFLICFQSFFSELFFGSTEYKNLIGLSAISILIGSTNSIVSAPTRMNNNRRLYLVANILSSVISYAISVPLLLNGKYLIALPISAVLAALSIEIIFLIANKNWFDLRMVKKSYIADMLKIALPLMPNFLVYWVFNSFDRLMIAKMLGNDYAGIYAIGGKIGQISQFIYVAFAGGWQYFAFSTMKDKDQVEMTSNIFEYLTVVSLAITAVMMSCTNLIFDILFTGDYLKGAIVAPYLFASPLLLMLYQVVANQFIVIKKTLPNMFILGGGAVLNVILNFILIPKWGIEGAALATFIGYMMALVICVCVLARMNLIRASYRLPIISIIFLMFFILWRFFYQDNLLKAIILALIVCVVYVLLYKKDIMSLIKKEN